MASQDRVDAPVAVAALGLGESLVDLGSKLSVPVRGLQGRLAVEERGTRQPRCLEQKGQGMGCLEGNHGADFQRRGWFLKARTFFR